MLIKLGPMIYRRMLFGVVAGCVGGGSVVIGFVREMIDTLRLLANGIISSKGVC